MKRGILLLLACVLTAGISVPLLSSQNPTPGDRANMWKKVDDAINQGLPQTAIEQLKPILERALADKAYPEAIKALAKRIKLEAEIQGGGPNEGIIRLKQELETAPAEIKPTLHAILGHWYWSYFTENRWQFARRTATTSSPSEDFTTWDLPRLFAEIDRCYSAALADPESLKKVPIQSYDILLLPGTFPDEYRPTLYDFLVHAALEFYTAGEQAGTQREDAFVLEASSPILGTVEDFLAWTPKTTDTDSPKFKAIRLYQDLLRFHADDADVGARLDANIDRLRFGHAQAVGEENNSRTQAALRQIADASATHPLSALARYRLAEILRSDNNLLEAHEVASQGRNAFPESIGGKLCSNLIAEIEAKSINVQSERVWNAPWPNIRVRYRNLNKVYFRAIPADWQGRFSNNRWQPDEFNQQDVQEVRSKTSAAQWSSELPETDDYQEATHDVDVPKTLKPGYYIIVYSHREDFADANNVIGACGVWVSKLAIVIRQQWNTQNLSGLVLDNQTGYPISGATIRSIYRDPQTNALKNGPTSESDANGIFNVPLAQNYTFIIASHGGHSLASGDGFSWYPGSNNEPTPVATFFTDRSIYRPGQTIQFKGIAMILDPNKNRYELVKNAMALVELLDPNGQVIETLELRSNDYGSFSGSFTAPRNRGTGRMTIRTPSFSGAATQISVEEYKRPKFQVTVDLPKDSPKLGDTVTIHGNAMSYTGAPIQNAKIRYRVVREVRFPDWFMFCYGWRIAPNLGQSQEIGHGFATTELDGSFHIDFVARPDRSIPESDQPIFRYTVTADVTDGTGETRSGDVSLSVGYTTLQANLTAEDWQTTAEPLQVKLTTSNLNGIPLSAAGTIKVYRLKEPDVIERSDLLGDRRIRPQRGARRPGVAGGGKAQPSIIPPDRSQVSTWPLADIVAEKEFKTLEDGKQDFRFELPRGLYRVVLESQDRLGKPVQSELNVKVIDPAANTLGLKIPHLFTAQQKKVEPGDTWRAVWGSGYDKARAYVEVEHRGKLLQKYWTPVDKSQVVIEQPIDESMRGGFTVRVTFVHDNRAYIESRTVAVPWTNKELTLKWERFRSKLEPGAKEQWSLKITGPQAATVAAEMVAGLYDASLDAFLPHNWPERLGGFYSENATLNSAYHNYTLWFTQLSYQLPSKTTPVSETVRRFPEDLKFQVMRMFSSMGGMGGRRSVRGLGAPGAPMPMSAADSAGMAGGGLAKNGLAEAEFADTDDRYRLASAELGGAGKRGKSAGGNVALGNVAPRKNLNETAFFFPQLRMGKDETVTLEFTLPEALTKWRFMAFAHDQELRSGSLFDTVVSTKDLMVQPNPPRFLRESDVIEFSAKVTNQSNSVQQGKVALQLSDAVTEANLDSAFENSDNEQAFELPASESRSFRWRLKVPEGAKPILFRTIAATDSMSDGEQGMLPVLSNRILVHESIQLPIRGKSTKEFELKKLLESADSTTLKNQSLTVQMTSQPAWYAVLALPYLMEYPYDCSEQTFNRLYANSLARHIAKRDPKIERVFETWRTIQPEALESPLSKNEDLKSVMIEETPWLRAANRESQSRRNVGLLFDTNRLESEVQTAHNKLAQMQRENGMWPWFPGGPDNEYLSLYIVTGFGRLRNLGVQVDEAVALRALDRLDAWMHEIYDRIEDKDPSKSHLSSLVAFYLYGRSFFLADRPIAENHTVALNYWKAQAKTHWLTLDRQSQAHIAVAMKRLGDKELPGAILKSLRERSVTNEEFGMFWRDTERSWWWYHAPIETQAMMIEAFDEVAADENAVEECKVWLLKQKQTQDWKTTKATADAVYALLRRGENWLRSDALVSVKLAGVEIQPEKVEAGTGFYEERIEGSDIRPEMGRVTVTKSDAGVSWGGLHWQYLEDINKITPHDGTPLNLEKKIFKRVLTGTGPVLEEVTGPVEVGDELVCRIVLRSDRDMEYVHMKDYRGSGTEPVNVLSSYKFQDGIFYYESTRDTATHFFIDYLRKGTYVFEYTLRVQHAGDYPTGYASIECMYAPEFNSHSGSIRLEVK
ncbi:MAG: alpha-2-macroglobulin family protein [Planctomycetota bacterium]